MCLELFKISFVMFVPIVINGCTEPNSLVFHKREWTQLTLFMNSRFYYSQHKRSQDKSSSFLWEIDLAVTELANLTVQISDSQTSKFTKIVILSNRPLIIFSHSNSQIYKNLHSISISIIYVICIRSYHTTIYLISQMVSQNIAFSNLF